MDKILKNIQEGYINGLKKAKETSDIICPFCEQEDFDLEGLKSHFIYGYCEVYNKTESLL